jgi:hypothetical protein
LQHRFIDLILMFTLGMIESTLSRSGRVTIDDVLAGSSASSSDDDATHAYDMFVL